MKREAREILLPPPIISENLYFFDKKDINCSSKNAVVMIYLTISGFKRRKQPAFLLAGVLRAVLRHAWKKEEREAVL